MPSPMGSRSSHMMVKPRMSACFFIRSNILTSPSMVMEREIVSSDVAWEEGPWVVMAASCYRGCQ